MKKLLIRLLLFFLIPSLIVDPAMAYGRPAPVSTKYSLTHQALQEPQRSALFSTPLFSPKKNARGIALIAAMVMSFFLAPRAAAQMQPFHPGSSPTRQFVERVLVKNGGTKAFIEAHPDLQAATAARPGFDEQLARASIFYDQYRNGGFSGFRVSNRGHNLESLLQTLIEAVIKKENTGLRFIKHPTAFATSVILDLPEALSFSKPEDLLRVKVIFSNPSSAVSMTPMGAYVLLGAGLLEAGICPKVGIVESVADHKLLLRLWLDSRHDFFIRVDEDKSEFGVRRIGAIKKPGMDAIRNYEWAKSLGSSLPSVVSQFGKLFGHTQAIQNVVDFFLDLRCFLPLARNFGPLVFSPEGEVFYSLPDAQQQRLFRLASLYRELEVLRGSPLTVYPHHVVENLESRGTITASNFPQKVKEFQSEIAKNAVQPLSLALQGSEDLEKFVGANGDIVQSRYGELFIPLREALKVFVKLSQDDRAALQEFAANLKHQRTREMIIKHLRLGAQNQSPASTIVTGRSNVAAAFLGIGTLDPRNVWHVLVGLFSLPLDFFKEAAHWMRAKSLGLTVIKFHLSWRGSYVQVYSDDPEKSVKFLEADPFSSFGAAGLLLIAHVAHLLNGGHVSDPWSAGILAAMSLFIYSATFGSFDDRQLLLQIRNGEIGYPALISGNSSNPLRALRTRESRMLTVKQRLQKFAELYLKNSNPYTSWLPIRRRPLPIEVSLKPELWDEKMEALPRVHSIAGGFIIDDVVSAKTLEGPLTRNMLLTSRGSTSCPVIVIKGRRNGQDVLTTIHIPFAPDSFERVRDWFSTYVKGISDCQLYIFTPIRMNYARPWRVGERYELPNLIYDLQSTPDVALKAERLHAVPGESDQHYTTDLIATIEGISLQTLGPGGLRANDFTYHQFLWDNFDKPVSHPRRASSYRGDRSA